MTTIVLTVVAVVIGAVVLFASGWVVGAAMRNNAVTAAAARRVSAFEAANKDLSNSFWGEWQRAESLQAQFDDLKARAYLRDGKGRIKKAADVLL